MFSTNYVKHLCARICKPTISLTAALQQLGSKSSDEIVAFNRDNPLETTYLVTFEEAKSLCKFASESTILHVYSLFKVLDDRSHEFKSELAHLSAQTSLANMGFKIKYKTMNKTISPARLQLYKNKNEKRAKRTLDIIDQMNRVNKLTDFLEGKKLTIEICKDTNNFVGVIEGVKGLYAQGKTLNQMYNRLAEVLEMITHETVSALSSVD